MDSEVLKIARTLAERYLAESRDGLVDGRLLMKAGAAAYLCGSGVPTDEAVQRVDQLVVPALMGPVPANPMYHGLPWLVPGPVSGAPYYAER